MRIVLSKTRCTVLKDAGDPHFSGVKNAAGESRLLYHIKIILNSYGFNFIKKRMWRDGHLVDEMQQYLRVKKEKPNSIFGIWNTCWAIQGADYYLNKYGRVELNLEWADNTPQDIIGNFSFSCKSNYDKKTRTWEKEC